MGQSQANEWIHSLLPILKQALDDLGYAPERDPKKFKKKEQDRKDAVDSIIDGTERRRQRPKQAEKQCSTPLKLDTWAKQVKLCSQRSARWHNR